MQFLRPLAPCLRLAALIGAALALAACQGPIHSVRSDEPKGAVAIAVAPLFPTAVPAEARAVVTLTRDHLVRTADLEVVDGAISASFSGLPAGDWSIEIELIDGEGDITHSATGSVRVRPGQTAAAILSLTPIDGALEIVVDLSGFPGVSDVQGVRVTFHDNRYVTLVRSADDPARFAGVKPLASGDYDFNVALYGATFLAGDRIYVSPWESVRIASGKTAQVYWRAETGSASLTAELVPDVPAPTTLQIEERQGEMWLVWDAVEHPALSGYRIYVKKDELLPFAAKAESPAGEPGVRLAEVWTGKEPAWLAVTAVAADGSESYRSPAVWVEP